MLYNEALKWAEDYDTQQFLSNRNSLSRFNTWVELILEDGSHFTWAAGYVVCHPDGEWMAVNTEHYGCNVFSLDDIMWWRVFELKDKGDGRA